jgi:RimJ/RimL family protein N-acetyltransferase
MLLTGERVRLREFRREDVPAIQAWVNDVEINQYLGFWRTPQSLVETERFVERCLTQDAAHGVELAICLKDDPEERYVGACGLSIDTRNRWASLGIVIGRKDLHGQGLGRDAILTMLDYAFGFLDLNKVNLDHAEFNERASRCYRACGFREEGRVRQRWFRDGRHWDMVNLGITRDEFEAARHR